MTTLNLRFVVQLYEHDSKKQFRNITIGIDEGVDQMINSSLVF